MSVINLNTRFFSKYSLLPSSMAYALIYFMKNTLSAKKVFFFCLSISLLLFRTDVFSLSSISVLRLYS